VYFLGEHEFLFCLPVWLLLELHLVLLGFPVQILKAHLAFPVYPACRNHVAVNLIIVTGTGQRHVGAGQVHNSAPLRTDIL